MTAQHNRLPAARPGTQDQSLHRYDPAIRAERVALVDLLDRVLGGGVVIAGDVTLSIADVDLVTVSLRALVTSASALVQPQADRKGPVR
jgi:hypothetical protein